MIKLANICFFGWKDVGVIPGYPTDQTNVVLVLQELRSGIKRRRQVLIAFNYYNRRIGKFHGILYSADASPNHIIELTLTMSQYMNDDRSNSRFTMATGNHNTLLIF